MANIYCNLKVFSLRARNESPALLNRIECRYVPQSQNWCMRTERCHRLILFPPRALLIAPDITLHRIAPKIPVPPHISTWIRWARRSKLNRRVVTCQIILHLAQPACAGSPTCGGKITRPSTRTTVAPPLCGVSNPSICREPPGRWRSVTQHETFPPTLAATRDKLRLAGRAA